MMGRDGERMFDQKPVAECMPNGGKRYRRRQETGCHDGEFDGRLPTVVSSLPQRLFIPSAIAFQSSWSRGLNTVIANIAITTRTPTRIAYSVVPCPD